MEAILNNHSLFVVFWAWFIAQFLKVLSGLIREKKLNFKWILNPGGMPSSHSAIVTSLAVEVGTYYGFDSPNFTICAAIGMIVMYDASGVRLAAGRQAEAINRIIDDLYRGEVFPMGRFKEILGHTPLEVWAGAALGIIVAVII